MNINGIKYNMEANDLCIFDSYKIKRYKDMKAFLDIVKEKYYFSPIFEQRSMFSLRMEWSAHNLLYDFGYQRERTKDVDLDIITTPRWLYDTGYFILGCLYRIFHW